MVAREGADALIQEFRYDNMTGIHVSCVHALLSVCVCVCECDCVRFSENHELLETRRII